MRRLTNIEVTTLYLAFVIKTISKCRTRDPLPTRTKMATQTEDSLLDPRKLVLLHVTDVHVSFKNIQRLKTWLKEKQQRVDVVLLSGDLANIPMEFQETSSKEELAKHHQDLVRVVDEFVPIAQQVFYLPGNHDVITTFRTNTTDPVTSPTNVHLRQVGVAPALHLLGAGGSIPGFRNGKKYWGSFPYTSDEEFAKDLTKVLDPFFFPESPSSLGQQDAVILMTHNGPDQCSTTLARANPTNPISSGSATLYEYICKEQLQQHVIMNIHGHTHDAPGCVTVGKTAVINPGALVEERFGIYTLTSHPDTSPCWRLSSVQLLKLPHAQDK